MTVPLRRIKRERGADLDVLIRGCPRNCKRLVFVTKPLGSGPGKATKNVGREPGDLPSTVVMREHVGRGVQTGSRTEDPKWGSLGDFDRGDVPHGVPPEVFPCIQSLMLCDVALSTVASV